MEIQRSGYARGLVASALLRAPLGRLLGEIGAGLLRGGAQRNRGPNGALRPLREGAEVATVARREVPTSSHLCPIYFSYELNELETRNCAACNTRPHSSQCRPHATKSSSGSNPARPSIICTKHKFTSYTIQEHNLSHTRPRRFISPTWGRTCIRVAVTRCTHNYSVCCSTCI
ncbi:unnamed protein product [Trichogramma brassicae]|uniref:Uncharacterized protein n=1 Tax=Trichogramma brassicae TaxID=86971 RepID=A0A6H5IKS9_9HYME|nr:unnamed protein product [Trichogramma brassicae]